MRGYCPQRKIHKSWSGSLNSDRTLREQARDWQGAGKIVRSLPYETHPVLRVRACDDAMNVHTRYWAQFALAVSDGNLRTKPIQPNPHGCLEHWTNPRNIGVNWKGSVFKWHMIVFIFIVCPFYAMSRVEAVRGRARRVLYARSHQESHWRSHV